MLGKKKTEPLAGIEPTTLGGWLSNFFRQNNPNFTKDCNMPFNASSLKVLAALCVLGSVYMEVGYPRWVR